MSILAFSNLGAGRAQMAVSLGFHIVFACLGVGLPVLLLYAEYRTNRMSDRVWMALAKRWAKGYGILFAGGAVSGDRPGEATERHRGCAACAAGVHLADDE